MRTGQICTGFSRTTRLSNILSRCSERRQLQGLEAIKMYFAATSALPLKLRMQNLIIHQTANSEVVVAEWDYDVLVTTTGHTCNVSNITVTTVRIGKIVVSRDYHNHAILARALGR